MKSPATPAGDEEMRKFTTAEVQAIIEADRAGRIHLDPKYYTDATLAAALKQYRDLPMVGTEAHPGYQHAWGKNDLCIYKGCKAGPAELEAEYQAAKSARDRQDCETPAGMEAARAAARSLIAEMEQPTGHPYKASTTSPLCEVCGERKINRYGTHGLSGLEQGDQQAPAEQPAPITAGPRRTPVYVDRITDGDGITRTLSTPVRLL